MEDLVCGNDEEYMEILGMIENEIGDDAKGKEEEVDAKALLNQWKMRKYWDAMEEMDVTEVEHWETLKDEDLEYLVFNTLHKRGFKKKLAKFLKKKKDENSILSTREQRLFQSICRKLCECVLFDFYT